MRLFAALLLVACNTSSNDMLPVIPGGGGGTGGTGKHDAAVDGTGDAAQLAGRVCLAADPRDLVTCATTGAGTITVTLGSATATTADDGTFAIDAPQGTNLTWHATGTNIVTSVMPYGTVALIPALGITTYNDLVNANGLVFLSGQGSIFVRVLESNMPVTGATAAASPAAPNETRYETSNALMWQTNNAATGAHGVAWIPGEAVGVASIAVTPGSGSASTVPSVPVEDGAITFVAAEIP